MGDQFERNTDTRQLKFFQCVKSKMDSKYYIACLIVLVCNLVTLDRTVAAREAFYSYETRTNSIDDGNKLVSRIEERKRDSLSPEIIKKKVIVGPSNFRPSHNSWINRQQIRTNSIGTGLERVPGNLNKALEKLSNAFNRRSNAMQSNPPRRGFLSRARTVESPALSVDSGGQASSSTLAQEMAKLLEIKQGYYADLYNKMDRTNIVTKRPAEAIEDAMRASVLNLFKDQQQNSHS